MGSVVFHSNVIVNRAIVKYVSEVTHLKIGLKIISDDVILKVTGQSVFCHKLI